MSEQIQQTDIVAEFVKNLVPKELLETAQLLVSLTYPISDRKSLIRQLETRKAQDPQGQGLATFSRPLPELIESVVEPFRPEDFGIASPDNALEKFFARTRQDFRNPLDPIPKLPELPGGIPEPPDFADPFFGPGPCGEAAAQLWREHLNSRRVRWFGPDPFYYDALQDQADNCRRGWRLPFRTDMLGDLLCSDIGNAAYARCVMAGGSDSDCRKQGHQARDSCRERVRRPPVSIWPSSGRGSDFF